MNIIFADSDVGRKNIATGLAVFLMLGFLIGIPLTIDFLGGSLLSEDQYQTWKVVHAYGVFLAFINYFFGMTIDRVSLPRMHKELASWMFLLAGCIGGFGRAILVLLGNLSDYGIYVSLLETVSFVVATIIFVRGIANLQPGRELQGTAGGRYSHAK